MISVFTNLLQIQISESFNNNIKRFYLQVTTNTVMEMYAVQSNLFYSRPNLLLVYDIILRRIAIKCSRNIQSYFFEEITLVVFKINSVYSHSFFKTSKQLFLIFSKSLISFSYFLEIMEISIRLEDIATLINHHQPSNFTEIKFYLVEVSYYQILCFCRINRLKVK